MKIGVKIYTRDHHLIPKYAEYVDFIEVLVEPSLDYKVLKDYGVDYVIHVPHHKFGFNPADKNSWDISKEILDHSKNAADFLGAKKMIIHSGHFAAKDSNENNLIDFINLNYDQRFILENLPMKTKYNSYLFATPNEVENISAILNLGICLDFSHAVCTSVALHADPLEIIKQINNLHPKHYHISDGWLNEDTDRDLHFFQGNYPLDKFKELIPKDGEVTIETYHDNLETKIKEIEFLRQ